MSAGTDLCCGDEYSNLAEALERGMVTRDTLEQAATRALTQRFELGMFDPPEV